MRTVLSKYWKIRDTIERIPDRLAKKRSDNLIIMLKPIYNRAGKVCKNKGQKHLKDFE